MPLEYTVTPDGAQLVFTGALGVSAAEQLAGELRSHLGSSAGTILVNLTSVESADVTFFQILISLQKSLNNQNQKLAIQPLPPGHPVLQSASLLGFAWETFCPEKAAEL